jgi:co-chaperonin GroES (HSP10)
MNFKPSGKNVLLEKKAVEEVKQGSLIIVPGQKSSTTICTVCGFGDKIELSLSCGQEVMIHSHAGYEVDLSGNKYLIIDEQYILGVFDLAS